jgi:tetratricopeptide (TPR) repeat protein
MTRRRLGWGAALAGVCGITWGAWTLTAQQGELPGSPAERIAVLERRVQAEPRPDLYFELGRLKLAQGREDAGLEDLARAVGLAPAGHHVQAYFLHQLDKTRNAGRVDLHARLAKILPDYPPLLERLGRLYQGKGRDGEAEALYRRWVKLRPANAEPYARLAEFQRAAGRPKEAIGNLEKVRTLSGESTYALRRLGVLYRETGDADTSAARLERAIAEVKGIPAAAARAAPSLPKIGPEEDLVAVTELGHTRMAQNRPRDAAAAFAEAVRMDPGSPAFRLFQARALEAAGDLGPARAAYEKAIGLDKFSLDAQLGLGRLLVKQGQPGAALPHLKEASSRNDRDPELHFLVGRTALAAGDLDTARREQAKLEQILSTSLAAKLHELIEAHGGS